MNRANPEFPYNLYQHLDDFLLAQTAHALTNEEIAMIMVTVTLATENLALLSDLENRYDLRLDEGSKSLSRLALDFCLRRTGTPGAHTLDLEAEEEDHFYLLLMVISYLKGFSSYGLMRRLATKRLSQEIVTEALYLTSQLESLSYFYPIERVRTRAA